jgi:hypothetical protein
VEITRVAVTRHPSCTCRKHAACPVCLGLVLASLDFARPPLPVSKHARVRLEVVRTLAARTAVVVNVTVLCLVAAPPGEEPRDRRAHGRAYGEL